MIQPMVVATTSEFQDSTPLDLVNIDFISRFKKLGFCFIDLNPSALHELQTAALSKVSFIDIDLNVIRSGASINITDIFSTEELSKLQEIGLAITNSRLVKSYIPFPELIGTSINYSIYDERAFAHQTHAHIWHRDADDCIPQLKVLIPLVNTNKENGMFSFIPKNYTPWNESLVDNTIVNRLSAEDSDFVRSDIARVSDEKMRSSKLSHHICDFESRVGEAVMIDTNSCYHKGGLIADKDHFRLLAQITIGCSLTHMWKDESSALGSRLRRHIRKAFSTFYGTKNKGSIAVTL